MDLTWYTTTISFEHFVEYQVLGDMAKYGDFIYVTTNRKIADQIGPIRVHRLSIHTWQLEASIADPGYAPAGRSFYKIAVDEKENVYIFGGLTARIMGSW